MIGPLLIGSEPSCKKIRKEEKFQDRKHDKQLEKNNFPQNPAQRHLAEPVPVEMINSQEKIALMRAQGIHDQCTSTEVSVMSAALVAADKVSVEHCEVRETRKRRRLKTPDGPLERVTVYRDWEVHGQVDRRNTEIVVNDNGRIIFGKCDCEFFTEHLLNQGPCAHMLALFESSEPLRADPAGDTPQTGS